MWVRGGSPFPGAERIRGLHSSHLFVTRLRSHYQVAHSSPGGKANESDRCNLMPNLMRCSKITVRLPSSSVIPVVSTRHFFEKTRATRRRRTVAIQPSRCLVVLDVTNLVGCSDFDRICGGVGLGGAVLLHGQHVSTYQLKKIPGSIDSC